jgi:hypothetical protein
MKRLFILNLTILCAASVSSAQYAGNYVTITPKTQEAGVTETHLTVHPAPQPRPALKYRLLPERSDQTPGNAATLYLMADELQPGFKQLASYSIDNWMAMPVKDWPRDEVQKMLKESGVILRYLELGARRERYDLSLPIQSEGFNTLLPNLSQQRTYAKILSIKIRLEAFDGQIEHALHDLQTGYSFGRQIGSGDTLIEALVGIAILSMMDKNLEEILQHPDAPNLYWALANLPRPMVDLSRALEFERDSLYVAYPQLRGKNIEKLTPAEWRSIQINLLALVGFPDDGKGAAGRSKLVSTLFMMKLYPEAKKHLIAHQGRDAGAVQAMPVQQAVALYMNDTYAVWRDDLFKWFGLPYWQAREGMQRTNQAFSQYAGSPAGKINIFLQLLPALGRAKFMEVRSDRQIAILQTIEAVRMYAADHDGKLPANLADIAEAPAPIDPMTGKPFEYKVEGDTFTLDAPAPPGERAQDGERYIVTMKRK